MICNECKKETNFLYTINGFSFCQDCYEKIKVEKNIFEMYKQIKELKNIAEDYHNICNSYESFTDDLEKQRNKDLEEIREVVAMYGKGLNSVLYNQRIKPILNHIDYKINILKENK